MTYKYLANRILDYAMQNKVINYAMEGAVSELNYQTVLQYPVFLVSPTGTHRERDGVITYALSFFYFDRLLNSEENNTEVYSTGMMVLKQIITNLWHDDEIMAVGDEIDYNFYVATDGQVLNDVCCGVWANVNITVPSEIVCPD